MHRFLLSPPSEYLVDHKDGNSLNNTRANLRLVTPAQNTFNKQPVNGLKGITFHKQSGKWQAATHLKYRDIYIGLFDDPITAARAYDVKAKELFGEFARLNFPDEKVCREPRKQP